MDRQISEVGGSALFLAAVLSAGGGFLHAPQPATLEAFAALDAGRWHLSHVAIAVGGTLFVAAALLLARHAAGTRGEAWALAGAGVLLVGGIGLLMVGALETTGFARALGMREADAVAAEHTFQAMTSIMTSLAQVAGAALAAAAVAYGAAMRTSGLWPGWLAWSGIGIGAGLLLVRIFGITPPAAMATVPFYLNIAWWAAAGVVLLRVGRAGVFAGPPPKARV